jgi:hypothetical protein
VLGITKVEKKYYALLDRGVKLSLIQKSLLVLELLLEEDFKIVKRFMPRSKKML